MIKLIFENIKKVLGSDWPDRWRPLECLVRGGGRREKEERKVKEDGRRKEKEERGERREQTFVSLFLIRNVLPSQ